MKFTIGDVLKATGKLPKDSPPPKKWHGSKPEVCDACHQPLKKFFVDGRSTSGPWGIFCDPCHRVYGVGLGVGRGQRYNLETLEKVGG